MGNYSNKTTDKKKQRHLIRAILLCEYACGIATVNNSRKTTLKSKTLKELKTEAGTLASKNKAIPTAIRTKSSQTEASGFGPGNIVHEFEWGSSSNNLDQLCYIPTREMVTYSRLRVGERWIDIPKYGKEDWGQVDKLLANPWHPEQTMMPDNPSCPGDIWNGPQGGGRDIHSQANVGPIVGVFVKDKELLVDSEYWALQEYQYNATGDPNTWIRDYHKAPGSPVLPGYTVTVNHANDGHWTTFQRGKWLLKRRIYQRQSDKQWMFEFTKQGNEPSNKSEKFTTTVPVRTL